jgi:hypothetical protein
MNGKLGRMVGGVKPRAEGRIPTHAPNGNDSLAPPKRGEGWGEGN